MKNFKKLLFCTFTLSVMFVSKANAATQGTEGTTSTGTTVVSVIVPKLVKITGLSNIAFGSYAGTGALSSSTTACIYANMDTGSGTYSATITSSNPGTTNTAGFYLGTAGQAQEIPFAVAWNSDNNTTDESAYTYGNPKTAQDGFSNELDCSDDGNANANIHVTVAQADILDNLIRPATYSATLTIVIAPE